MYEVHKKRGRGRELKGCLKWQSGWIVVTLICMLGNGIHLEMYVIGCVGVWRGLWLSVKDRKEPLSGTRRRTIEEKENPIRGPLQCIIINIIFIFAFGRPVLGYNLEFVENLFENKIWNFICCLVNRSSSRRRCRQILSRLQFRPEATKESHYTHAMYMCMPSLLVPTCVQSTYQLLFAYPSICAAEDEHMIRARRFF